MYVQTYIEYSMRSRIQDQAGAQSLAVARCQCTECPLRYGHIMSCMEQQAAVDHEAEGWLCRRREALDVCTVKYMYRICTGCDTTHQE
jgi:hypothetical protein